MSELRNILTKDDYDRMSQCDRDFMDGLSNLCRNLCDRYDIYRDELFEHCKSPIERHLGGCLIASELGFIVGFAYMRPHAEDPFATGISLQPQRKIGPYTVDFAMFFKYEGLATVKVAIECDGHDFHEKTKEQAAHDKARDRYLLAEGWPVMRFTGSEIFKDAPGCAAQVIKYLGDHMARAIDAHRERGSK